MKHFLIVLALLALLASPALGTEYKVHGSLHATASSTDVTMNFQTTSGSTVIYHPISSFTITTEQDLTLDITFDRGGKVSDIKVKAGDTLSYTDVTISEIVIDVTGATTYDMYW